MSYPGGSKPKDSGALRPRLYVIRNAKLLPAWMDTPPDLLGIAARAVSSLVRTQGIGDLFRTYFQAQTEGFEFFLATIPADFDVKRTEEFDPVFMAALFERGFDMARRGYPWQTTPPSSENLTKAPSRRDPNHDRDLRYRTRDRGRPERVFATMVGLVEADRWGKSVA